MSLLYLLLLSLVSVAIVAVSIDAVLSATRKREWQVPRFAASRLVIVETEDRRRGQLPFVGADRRRAAAADAARPQPARQAA